MAYSSIKPDTEISNVLMLPYGVLEAVLMAFENISKTKQR